MARRDGDDRTVSELIRFQDSLERLGLLWTPLDSLDKYQAHELVRNLHVSPTVPCKHKTAHKTALTPRPMYITAISPMGYKILHYINLLVHISKRNLNSTASRNPQTANPLGYQGFPTFTAESIFPRSGGQIENTNLTPVCALESEASNFFVYDPACGTCSKCICPPSKIAAIVRLGRSWIHAVSNLHQTPEYICILTEYTTAVTLLKAYVCLCANEYQPATKQAGSLLVR